MTPTSANGGPGVVCGLADEAALFRRHAAAAKVRCAGADAAVAGRLAVDLIAEGCAGVVSFGLAGGLDPGLSSGTLIIADGVADAAGHRIATDAAWRERLMAALADAFGGGAIVGTVAGVERPVLSPADKAALRDRTGAAAVDLESGSIATVAASHGVPFVVIRALADAADRVVPAWAATCIGKEGRPRIGFILGALAADPRRVSELIGLAGDSRRGLATLRRAILFAGPSLQLDG